MVVVGLASPAATGTLVLRDRSALYATVAEERSASPHGRLPSQPLAELIARAGILPSDVRTVVFAARRGTVGDDDPLVLTPIRPREWVAQLLPHAQTFRLSAPGALARHAAGLVAGDSLVFVGEDCGIVAKGPLATIRTIGRVSNDAAVSGVIAKTAAGLGIRESEPLAALDVLSAGSESPWAARFTRVFAVDGAGAIHSDLLVLESLLREAADGLAGPLDDPEPLHVKVAARRTELAAGLCASVVTVVSDSLRYWLERAENAPLVVAGTWFAVPRLTARIASRLGRPVILAPLAGAPGRALGATLCGDVEPHFSLETLALGREYNSEEIKRALDRCRIDYIYEASWERLIGRAARMLARGKQVAWFQGRAGLGDNLPGNRSVLSDAANPYTRDNVNTFLLNRPVHSPLRLAVTAETVGELAGSHSLALGPQWATIVEPWRERLRGILDAAGGTPIQAVTETTAPQLRDLLATCRREHDIVGLVYTPLLSNSGAVAATPASAIASFFSSPVDALVIGRFLTMKDYWLMRADNA